MWTKGRLHLLLCLLLEGCALTSKGDVLAPRYFNPQVGGATRSEPAVQPFELRLGQVSSAAQLDERISYRISATEVGFYDNERWTEPPDQYLRRALERELFERRKLTRVVTGAAPVLEIELTGFEELRQQPTKVRVTLKFSLTDERRSLLEQSVELERPLGEPSGADTAQRVAQALAVTLAEAVQMVGDQVVKRLSGLPKPENRDVVTPQYP